jgi:hypothetical protein
MPLALSLKAEARSLNRAIFLGRGSPAAVRHTVSRQADEIMKKHPGIREAAIFVAGLLVGLSIVLAVFATMAGDSVFWPALWLLPPLVAFAFGVALQYVVVVPRRPSRQTWRLTHRLAERRMVLGPVS